MIKVWELQPTDLIEMGADDQHGLEVARKSIGYTLRYDNTILFCGGIHFYREGFGEIWIVFSHQVVEHTLLAVRQAKRILEDMIQKYHLYRLQATVRCDWHKAQRFVEFMGFQREGTLRQYGPDHSDYYMYSRIS